MKAERRKLLESFGSAPDRLQMILRHFPRKMWSYKKDREHPSIHEMVWNLADHEVTEYIYCRCFVSERDSVAPYVDFSGWSDNLGYFHQDVKLALRIISSLRRATYHFLRQLPEIAWTYTAELPTYGQLSLEEWLRFREESFPACIDEMARVFSEWREAMISSANDNIAS